MSTRYTEADYAQLMRRHQELRAKSPAPIAPTIADPVPIAPVKPSRRRGPKAITKAALAADELVFQCGLMKLPCPEREFYFARPDREYRFDLAWPVQLLALEIEGLVFPEKPRWNEAQTEHRLSGRHVSAAGFLADLEKYGLAFSLGWSLLRCTHRQIEEGTVLRWLEARFKLPVLKGTDGDRPPDQSQPR